MEHARPLPSYLIERYRGWKDTTYAENKDFHQALAEGQSPRAMVISCCDSRVHPTSLFNADEGELFVHRNIANLVPPCDPSLVYNGTSAAVEYAVTALKVSHLVVLGHSKCGGAKGCLEMCKGNAPALEQDDSFVGRWIDILKHKFEKVENITDPAKQEEAMERQAVITSLENLMTFPFVAAAVESGDLTLHGLRTVLGECGMEYYDAQSGEFLPL